MRYRSIGLQAMLAASILALMVLAFSCARPRVAFSVSISSDSSQAIDRANVGFARAIAAVREAEASGANEDQLRVLVEKLNSAVWMIDRAESLLLQGDVEAAATQADRSIEVSKGIALEAVRLRDEASLRAYYGKVFAFGMVPVASLLVTVGTHYGWKWWRRREVDKTMRMEIRGVKEPEEET